MTGASSPADVATVSGERTAAGVAGAADGAEGGDGVEVASGLVTADPDDIDLAPVPRGLPIGWWGLAWTIATEAMLFAGLLSGWFFLQAGSAQWPQGGIEPPELGRPIVFTVILLSSSLPLVWGEAAIGRGQVARLRVALAVSFVLGTAFLVNQVLEYRELGFGLADNAYASLFYTTTGLHGLHVLVGLAMNVVVQIKAARGSFGAEHHLTVKIFTLYWHFVDVVWIAVFSSLYLTSHVT